MSRGRGIDGAALAFWLVLIGVTAFRIYLLRLNLMDLYFDEAQYWTWSQHFDWGYFTKPPLVAWTIRATTALFGDAEWAVRLAAPLAHLVASWALYALGRSMYGAWAGFWAGVGWLLMPGVALSAIVISTDALLLPLWSIALVCLWRLTQTRAWFWAVMLGLAVGLGVQAKYAMLYFPICAALAAYWVAPTRQALGNGRAIVALVFALIVIAPNIWWNVQNGFVTAEHTASNARIRTDDLFNPDELMEFIAGQIALIGPLLFAAFAIMLWRAGAQATTLRNEDKFLLAFILPTLVFVAVISFISRANANWAAAAYPAAMAWVGGSLAQGVAGRRFLAAANTLNGAIFAVLVVLLMYYPSIANQSRGLRDARTWEETAHEIAVRAAVAPGEAPFSAVLVDNRTAFFELTYYWRHARRAGVPLPPLRMWLLHGRPFNSAELTDPMRAAEGQRVLVVHMTPTYLPFVAADFTSFRTVEHLTIPLGGGVNRDLEISVGEGFAPVPRDAAFERRLREQF